MAVLFTEKVKVHSTSMDTPTLAMIGQFAPPPLPSQAFSYPALTGSVVFLGSDGQKFVRPVPQSEILAGKYLPGAELTLTIEAT